MSGAVDDDRGKAAKADVEYGKGMRGERCGVCVHFNPEHGSCDLVAGLIGPWMWCRLFARLRQ